jgi:hypothetical protein
MSGVICVWASIPDEGLARYQEDYIPTMRARLLWPTLHCEFTESGIGEPIGKPGAPWTFFTVYNVKDLQKANDECYDTIHNPPESLLTGPLAQARFDTRMFRNIRTWQADDWHEGKEILIVNEKLPNF